MLNSAAKDYVCPFMTKLFRVGDVSQSDKVQCLGPECMAWNPTNKNEGTCNLAFPERRE